MNYHKTSIAEEIIIPELKLRNINELTGKMENDSFYKNNNKFRRFMTLLWQELIGFHNRAAAADLLRYEILRQEGGYYFDTDTIFILTGEEKLEPDVLPLGFTMNGYIPNPPRNAEEIDINKFDKMLIIIINDIIASLPNHPAIENTIEICLDRYERVLNTSTKQKGSIDFDSLNPSEITSLDIYLAPYETIQNLNSGEKMVEEKSEKTPTVNPTMLDMKRHPVGIFSTNPLFKEGESTRTHLTLEITGPMALDLGFRKFFNSKELPNLPNAKFDQTELVSCLVNYSAEAKVSGMKLMGIQVRSHSDMTWKGKKSSEKQKSFDTSDLPDKLVLNRKK